MFVECIKKDKDRPCPTNDTDVVETMSRCMLMLNFIITGIFISEKQSQSQWAEVNLAMFNRAC